MQFLGVTNSRPRLRCASVELLYVTNSRPRLHVHFNFYTRRTLVPASMHILTSITRDELSSPPPCTFELLHVTNSRPRLHVQFNFKCT